MNTFYIYKLSFKILLKDTFFFLAENVVNQGKNILYIYL